MSREAEEEHVRSAYDRHCRKKCWPDMCSYCEVEKEAKQKEHDSIIRKLKNAKCVDTREVLAFLGDGRVPPPRCKNCGWAKRMHYGACYSNYTFKMTGCQNYEPKTKK